MGSGQDAILQMSMIYTDDMVYSEIGIRDVVVIEEGQFTALDPQFKGDLS